MKFDGIPLFVSPQYIPKYPQQSADADLAFQTTKYPVVLALFGELWVFVPPAAEILHRGQPIQRDMIEKVLRPFYEKPKEYTSSDPEDRLMQAVMVAPYLEGLWVRIWGELVIEPSAGEGDAWVNPEEKVKGDMDQPIIGYAPWTYNVYVTKIDLDITPELEKAPMRLNEDNESSQDD